MNRRVLALLLLVTPTAAADEEHSSVAKQTARPNAIQLDLGLAVVGLAYERMVERRLALQVEAQIFGTWFGPIVDLPNFTGYGGQVRPTIFLTEDGPRGVYVSPFLRVNRVFKEIDGIDGSGVGFSTGAFAGYAFLLADRFQLRLGAGAQFMSYRVQAGSRLASFQSFFPGIDLVVGAAF